MQNKWQDKTKILLNIIEIYELINIEVEQQLIHPTRGVPQESIFGPTLSLISIDEILKELEKNKNIHFQAFVDDIAITAYNILHLQEAYDLFKEYITDKSMEINIDKCEILSNDIKDTKIDKTTNK